MSFIEAVVLGLVQGLTEFLPISSSGHVRVVGELMAPGEDPGAAFTAIIQLGTETAVLIYFWKDITRIIGRWFKALAGKIPHSDPDVRMGWLVILGSLPIGVLGLLFESQIDHNLRNLYITATMLIVFGILLGIADRFAPQRKELTELTVRDGILFGLAQALALIPGVSRSGGTITAGLLMGYTR
jgi:undecaprenyl-diphosphatase